MRLDGEDHSELFRRRDGRGAFAAECFLMAIAREVCRQEVKDGLLEIQLCRDFIKLPSLQPGERRDDDDLSALPYLLFRHGEEGLDQENVGLLSEAHRLPLLVLRDSKWMIEHDDVERPFGVGARVGCVYLADHLDAHSLERRYVFLYELCA